jgi:hypothetical protein
VTGADDARRHLERLAAEPRPAGSAAERAARAHAGAVLAASGFRVREESFEYSTVPGKLGTPVVGFLSVLVLFMAAQFGAAGRAAAAAAMLAGGLLLLGGGTVWLTRRGVLDLPFSRATSVNLVAERGSAPAIWLVAHLDSKSQPIPIAVRAMAIMLTIAAWVAAAVLVVLQLRGARVEPLWPVLAIIAVIVGLPVMSSMVGERSPGALDNASGVAAVLMTAAALPEESGIAVLLTSGEELGLAGARAWVKGRRPAAAINFDGVDDHGPVRLTYSGSEPRRLVSALRDGAAAIGASVSAGRLLPGVLLDGVALADAGWDVVTISRGSLSTVLRIHTPLDNLDRLQGTGIAQVATIAAHAVEATSPTSSLRR